MDFATQFSPACLLVDNGSLHPASTMTLRRIAAAVESRLQRPVEAVSLLHSSAVSAAALAGQPAETLEQALRRRYAAGVREFRILPLFFGPSGAIVDYIPKVSRELAHELADLRVSVADPVAGAGGSLDARLADLLADQVLAVMSNGSLHRPAVIVVDHGSPRREVAAVRDAVARQVGVKVAEAVRTVRAASMERRPGPEYDFADPLLEVALREPGALPDGDVVLALMFFSPGRHAGPGGDIEQICRAAEAAHADTHARVHWTPLVAEHPMLIEILADRYAQLLERERRG